MYSLLLVAVITALYLVAMGTSVIYYKRIRKARDEYEEAKKTVGHVIVSFNQQIQRQERELNATANKIGIVSSKNEDVERKVRDYDERLVSIANRIESVATIKQKLPTWMEDTNRKFDEVKSDQNKILQRIVEVEKLRHSIQVPEAKIEAAIPIRKEKALAPLTETELTVLEIIAKEGEKKAPEIREEIKLTREHTARLMKKLYEDGYLERDTRKMPYTYRLKEEMQKILKKRDTRA